MIYKILTRLLILLSINSCAQEYKKEYYDNGQIKETGKFSNGKKEELWKEFYETGKVKATINYKGGIRSGDFTVYHENGVVAKKGKLIKDTIAIGKWKWFYESKQLKKEGFFDDEGNQIGKWKVHHKNGKLMIIGNFPTGKQLRYFDDGITIEEKGFFKEGLKDGVWEKYLRIGNLIEKISYKDGKLNGKYEEYYKNGQIELTGFCINDNEIGEWKEFDSKGKITKNHFYNETGKKWSNEFNNKGNIVLSQKFIRLSNDSIVETFKSFYHSGKLLAEKGYNKEEYLFYKEFYENGKEKIVANQMKNGNFNHIAYHKNGQLKSSFIYEEYKEGFTNSDEYFNKLIDGNWKEFYENGNIAEEFSTKNGIIVGTHKIYFISNKQLEEVVNYNEKGEEIGEKKVYYENGNLANYTIYDEQRKKKKTKTFHENGNIAEEFVTKNRVVIISKEYTNNKSNHLKSISYFDGNGKYQRTDYYKEDGTKLNE